MRKLRAVVWHTVVACALVGACHGDASAQYKVDRIPGLAGLQAGSQPPPGIYVGGLLWVYPTDTIKDDDGNRIGTGDLSVTSSLPGIVVNWVTPYKLGGANVGGSFALPWIKNRIQRNVLDVDTGFAYTDTIFTPINLGWHKKKTDFLAAYNLYLPTGKFEPGGDDNSGLGMFGQELSFGSTVFNERRTWNGAALVSYEWHTEKKDTDIRPGQAMTIEGGVGRSFYKPVPNYPIPLITTVGMVGYTQFKVTEDSGDDVPPVLRGFKDRVFALGAEASVFIPQAKLTIVGRVIPEFGAHVRSQGLGFSITAVYVAKSLVPHR